MLWNSRRGLRNDESTGSSQTHAFLKTGYKVLYEGPNNIDEWQLGAGKRMVLPRWQTEDQVA